MWQNDGQGGSLSLPGGWTVSVHMTSTGLPPDDQGGMSLNACGTWCRLVRGGWDSGWHECQMRSQHKSREWWDLVETPADVKAAWLGCVGGIWPPPRYDAVFMEGVAWLNGLSTEET